MYSSSPKSEKRPEAGTPPLLDTPSENERSLVLPRSFICIAVALDADQREEEAHHPSPAGLLLVVEVAASHLRHPAETVRRVGFACLDGIGRWSRQSDFVSTLNITDYTHSHPYALIRAG